jgi:hypothetical protein
MAGMTTQAKQTVENAIDAGQKTTWPIEDLYSRVGQVSVEYHQRAFAMAKANFDASFDCLRELLAVKSPSDFMEVSMNHACRQLEALAEQTKELTAFAQRAATGRIEPLNTGVIGRHSHVASSSTVLASGLRAGFEV